MRIHEAKPFLQNSLDLSVASKIEHDDLKIGNISSDVYAHYKW